VSAYDDAVKSLVNGGYTHRIAREILAAVIAETRADDQRRWAARIREVGSAKGWSTWAAAYMDPDVEFVDTAMPSTETIVAELRRLDRAAGFREAAERLLAERRQHATRAVFCDGITYCADQLAQWADSLERQKDTSSGIQPAEGESTPAEPLIVSRYDTAMEPAPEEEPVFTVGAVAEDGQPVALLFDQETRTKVAGWLAPDAIAAVQLAHCTSFEIPWPGQWRPLLIHRSYAGGDRWWISDREGRRWHRDLGFVYEAMNEAEHTRTDTRFPLAEAWPLAHRIAAGEAPARAEGGES
jgi:hypothetical protein